VAQLHVLQRSAPYVLPKPDRPYMPLVKYLYRHFPAMLAATRTRQYVYHEARVLPLTKGVGVKAIEKAWERYFRAQITDEKLREVLRPDYAIGCKRVLISNDWYAALSRPNVPVIAAAPSTRSTTRQMHPRNPNRRGVDVTATSSRHPIGP
jgi:cation diffusion facilitator CzcD-associated flavoprotein CzcO